MGLLKSLGILYAINAKTPGDLAAGLCIVASEEEKEREKIEKQNYDLDDDNDIDNDDLDVSTQRIVNDLQEANLESYKKNIIDDLNEFIKEDRKNLNQQQLDKLYYYIKEASTCNLLTISSLIDTIMNYVKSLSPFIYIHTAMAELKEQVNSIDDSKLSKEVKLTINKLISTINNSVDIEELKYNLHELEVYMTEKQKISINFDYVYSELEKSIEKNSD